MVLDWPHSVAVEELRKGPLHHATVGEHVANARRHAQVVFEHHELACVQAQQIRTNYRDVDVARYLKTAHLPAIVLATVDKFARHNAIIPYLGFRIYVA